MLALEGVRRLRGVRRRNSDNTRLWQGLGWEPQTPLEEGLGSPTNGSGVS
jgi:nucleoside-diphosphate-sugar epimerase